MTDTNGGGGAIQVRDKAGEGVSRNPAEPHAKTSQTVYRPPMDLYEFDDRYEIHFDIPGGAPDHMNVSVNDSLLTVEARIPARRADHAQPVRLEYGVGDYRRQVRLGEDVDGDRLSAAYAGGVLKLTLPKRAERRPRRIPVTG